MFKKDTIIEYRPPNLEWNNKKLPLTQLRVIDTPNYVKCPDDMQVVISRTGVLGFVQVNPKQQFKSPEWVRCIVRPMDTVAERDPESGLYGIWGVPDAHSITTASAKARADQVVR